MWSMSSQWDANYVKSYVFSCAHVVQKRQIEKIVVSTIYPIDET